MSLDAIASAHDGYEAGGPEPTCTGWLDKKSGGKDGQSKAKLLEKWDKRWFALVGSELRYFKSEDDLAKGKAPAGSIECLGANVSLKKVKGQVFRFTVHTESREPRILNPSVGAKLLVKFRRAHANPFPSLQIECKGFVLALFSIDRSIA